MADDNNTQVVDAETDEQEILEVSETEVKATETEANSADSQEEVSDDTEIEDEATEESVPNNEEESEDSDSEEDDSEEQFVPISKLRKVRNEAKNLRERLKASEAQAEALESKLSERDDSALQAKINEYKTELEKERLSNSLASIAGKHGAIDPDVLITLVPLDKVEWQDSKPSNLDGVISELKERYPRQFRKTTGSGNVGSRDETNRKHVGDMTLQEAEQAYAEARKREKK